jgi:hypothetical protein
VCLLLQTTKIVALGDLGHQASLPAVVDLDAEFLHLLCQALLTGIDLARHLLEDPPQAPQFAAALGDDIQACDIELAGLDGRRRVREAGDLLQVLLHMVEGSVDGDF